MSKNVFALIIVAVVFVIGIAYQFIDSKLGIVSINLDLSASRSLYLSLSQVY
jgi:hypothetical protein